MGVCYRLIILDDNNFEYSGSIDTFDQVKDICPYALEETRLPNMRVYDINKMDPYRFVSITCSKMYFIDDRNSAEIQIFAD